MQTKDQTFSDYISTLRRRWRPATLVGGAIFGAFIALAFGLPAIYQSTASLLIEQKKIPDAMVTSTVASYANELLQSVQQRVMTTSNVSGIINKLKLYDEKSRRDDMGALVDDFRLNTLLQPAVASQVQEKSGRVAEVTYAFTVSFMYPDPQLAQKTASELATLYTKANESLREEVAARTTAFLDAEATRLQTKLADTGQRLGELRSKYGVQTTDNAALNISRYEQTDREMVQTDTDMRAARERLDLLQTQITSTPRYRPILDESGQPMLSGSDRLAQAQQELVGLRGRYSDDHPDIQRLRAEIASLSGVPADQSTNTMQISGELEARRQELTSLRQKYSADHPDVVRLQASIANLEQQLSQVQSQPRASAAPPAPTNPDYLSIITRMRTANEEIGALSRRRADLSARLAEYRYGVFPSPQVEKEFSDLTREYELLQTQYRDIATKQGEAALAQKLETEQTGERLTLIDPPRLPTVPVKPDRTMLSLLGAVLALAGALAVAAIMEATDKSVRGRKDVFALLGDSPLAIVPYIENNRDRRRRVRLNTMMASAAAATVALVVIVIVT